MELSGSNRVVIAFGSNLGQKEENIKRAIDYISLRCGKVTQVSNLYKSSPVGFDSPNEFLNGCLLLLTDLNPHALLSELKAIEVTIGRQKKQTNTYEDRCIDLDIILYENLCIYTPTLQIPHPRFQDRLFVTQPMQELSLDFFPF